MGWIRIRMDPQLLPGSGIQKIQSLIRIRLPGEVVSPPVDGIPPSSPPQPRQSCITICTQLEHIQLVPTK